MLHYSIFIVSRIDYFTMLQQQWFFIDCIFSSNFTYHSNNNSFNAHAVLNTVAMLCGIFALHSTYDTLYFMQNLNIWFLILFVLITVMFLHFYVLYIYYLIVEITLFLFIFYFVMQYILQLYIPNKHRYFWLNFYECWC